MEKDGVGFPSVGSPEDHHVGFFNFAIRACTAACSEHCGQTDHAGSVSSSVAGIDVVGTKHRPRKFLHQEVDFVGGFGARKHPDGFRGISSGGGKYFFEAFGRAG